MEAAKLVLAAADETAAALVALLGSELEHIDIRGALLNSGNEGPQYTLNWNCLHFVAIS